MKYTVTKYAVAVDDSVEYADLLLDIWLGSHGNIPSPSSPFYSAHFYNFSSSSVSLYYLSLSFSYLTLFAPTYLSIFINRGEGGHIYPPPPPPPPPSLCIWYWNWLQGSKSFWKLNWSVNNLPSSKGFKNLDDQSPQRGCWLLQFFIGRRGLRPSTQESRLWIFFTDFNFFPSKMR